MIDINIDINIVSALCIIIMYVQVTQLTKDNDKLTTECARLQTALQKVRKETQTKVDM